jgi:hypothetical protein
LSDPTHLAASYVPVFGNVSEVVQLYTVRGQLFVSGNMSEVVQLYSPCGQLLACGNISEVLQRYTLRGHLCLETFLKLSKFTPRGQLLVCETISEVVQLHAEIAFLQTVVFCLWSNFDICT